MLKTEMRTYSEEKNFEKALELRNQIAALEGLSGKQKVERDRKYDEDIINYTVNGGKVYVMMFNVYRGTLTNKNEYVFDYYEGFYDDFISRYYDENDVPKELIVPRDISEIVKDFLNKKRGSNVFVTVPRIGEKKKLLELVGKNIELSFFGDLKKVNELQNSLELNFTPEVIECFDVSHLSGTLTVGSMVQFRNGKPDKSNYRRFKIVSYIGNDDFSGIAEIVFRRYRRLKEENSGFPDLIVIDGGKGQLSAAIDSLRRLETSIPIISLAKKLEEVYLPGRDEPIRLGMKNKGLLYLREMRDEAHRFAIKYNRLLRGKRK